MSDPQLYSIEQWPATPGAELAWLQTATGRLRCAYWPSRHAQNPRGTVVLAHGLSEHIDKYYAPIAKLHERGFAVAAMDWRGHGMSAKFRDDADYLAQLDADIALFMQERVVDRLPRPYLAIGHSMGGCMMCCAAHDHPEWFSAVVLSAPMLGIHAAKKIPLFAPFVGLFKFIPPALRGFMNTSQPVCFTNDQKRFAAYCKLRETHKQLSATRDMALFVPSALQRISAMQADGWYQSISTPLLILAAEQEDLVDNQAMQEAAVRMPNAQFTLVDSARHELFMELDMVQAPLWAAFDNFAQQHAPVSRPAVQQQKPEPRDSIELKL